MWMGIGNRKGCIVFVSFSQGVWDGKDGEQI